MEPNQTQRFIGRDFLPILFLWGFGGSTSKTGSRGSALDALPIAVQGGVEGQRPHGGEAKNALIL